MIIFGNKNIHKIIIITKMQKKQTNLNLDQINQFKSYLSREFSGSRKKLTGDQMSKLKKSHFNQYIKKIKYYARKDLDKIIQKNARQFYPVDLLKNYESKEEATSILKKQKPVPNPQTHQPSCYYYGKAEISSMKEFIFLADECHKIQQNFNKVRERKANSQFIKKVEKVVQTDESSGQYHSKTLNLHLTLKSAKQIEENINKRRKSLISLEDSSRKSYQSFRKSFGSTNFTSIKKKSTDSLRKVFFNR